MKENINKTEEFGPTLVDLAPSEGHKNLKHDFNCKGIIKFRSNTCKQSLKGNLFDVKEDIKDMDAMFSEHIKLQLKKVAWVKINEKTVRNGDGYVRLKYSNVRR